VAPAKSVAVGQHQDACQRPPLEPLAQRPQGRSDRTRAPFKRQLLEILGGVQTGIEEVPAHVERFRERGLPARLLRIDQGAERVTAAEQIAGIVDLQALGIVRHDRKQIGPGARALPEPERLDEAQGQRDNAEHFEREADPAQRLAGGRAIAPGQHQGRDADREHRGPEPVPTGDGE
jgi:hypothetical protein